MADKNLCIIKDDETYCKADFSQLPEKQFFYENKEKPVSNIFKCIETKKFGSKFMIWQAICSCGLKSSAFVTKRTMNSDLYIKECLGKRLLPFIKKLNCRSLFWPDLAAIHYSRKVLDWCTENDVFLVPKEANPPNRPAERKIESFWAIVKGILRKSSKAVKTEKDMLKKWNNAVKNVRKEKIQSAMASTRSEIQKLSLKSVKASKALLNM